MSRIVRVRKIWEKQARAQLGQANGELAEAETETEAAKEEHRKAIAPAEEREATLDDLTIRRIAGMATHEKYTVAEVVRQQADHRARAAHGSWRRSAQDLEIAEKLEERRKQALAYLARRSAEAALDELMAMRRRQQ
jgi:hypothetical protein